MVSDNTLKRFYMWANREWFNGELPEDVVVYWEPTGRGVAEFRVIDADTKIIRVDPSNTLHDCHWKLGVAHELVHLKLYPNLSHGKRFDEEIQRLCGFRSYRKLL